MVAMRLWSNVEPNICGGQAVTHALAAYKPRITTMPIIPSKVLEIMGVADCASNAT